MTLQDYAQLFALLGVLLFGIGGMCFLGILFGGPSRGDGIPALVPWAKGPKHFLEDLQNPTIKFGGPLGIMLRLFVLAGGSLVVGGLLWLIGKIA